MRWIYFPNGHLRLRLWIIIFTSHRKLRLFLRLLTLSLAGWKSLKLPQIKNTSCPRQKKQIGNCGARRLIGTDFPELSKERDPQPNILQDFTSADCLSDSHIKNRLTLNVWTSQGRLRTHHPSFPIMQHMSFPTHVTTNTRWMNSGRADIWKRSLGEYYLQEGCISAGLSPGWLKQPRHGFSWNLLDGWGVGSGRTRSNAGADLDKGAGPGIFNHNLSMLTGLGANRASPAAAAAGPLWRDELLWLTWWWHLMWVLGDIYIYI